MAKWWLWGIVAVLAGAVLAVGGWKAWRYLHPPLAAVAALDPACDLHQGPCRSLLPVGGAAVLAIEPRPVRAMEPLTLRVTLEDVDARSIEVDFAGVDMNMGFNRFGLQEKAPGRFEGVAVLPVCIRNRMLWEAQVLIRTGDALIAAPYRFETSRQ